jgi:hypothetical protein
MNALYWCSLGVVPGGIKHSGTYLDAIWPSWSYFCFLGNRFGNANNGHGSHSGSHCGVRFWCPRFGSRSSSETSIWPPRESLGIRQTNFHMAKTPPPDLSTSSPKIRRSQGHGRSGSTVLPTSGGNTMYHSIVLTAALIYEYAYASCFNYNTRLWL